MISVILPTYNRAAFLPRTIHSIEEQSLAPEELIVIDDGSTDNTAEVVHRLAQTCRIPLHYVYQHNRGASAARNHGIRLARYPFLCFVDSDDWWLPQKLEKQAQAMDMQPEFPVSHTREIWYRRGVRVNQKKKHDPPHGDIFNPSLRMCMVGMSTVMIRREVFCRFGLFDEELPCCEDYDLWLRIACREPFLLVPDQLICKDGGREDQLSAQHRLGMDVYRIQSLLKLLEYDFLQDTQKPLVLSELQRKCMIYGNGCIKHGRIQEGEYYLNLAQRV